MCSSHSIALLLVSALVLCGCEVQRTPPATTVPISYRQRTDPPPRAVVVEGGLSPDAKPQPKPVRPVTSRPAGARREAARSGAAMPAGAQSVVYRREDARPQEKVAPREQPSGVGHGKPADEGKRQRQEPAPVASSGNPQGVRSEPSRKAAPAEPKRKDPTSDDAKLKALYDSGFLTREELIRAGNGK